LYLALIYSIARERARTHTHTHTHTHRYEYVPADHREEPLEDGESDDELTLEVGALPS
jgi:hypothetical protein